MTIFDQEDDNKDYLIELTGPSGKFDRTRYASDQEMYQAIAKSNVHGSKTIEHKNAEFDELREDAMKWRADSVAKERFDEYVKTHNNSQKQDDVTITPVTVQPSFDPTKLDELLDSKLQKIEAQKRETENFSRVDTILRERFGDNARSILKDKMNTLNLSLDDLKFLAKKSPDAVINALGLNSQREDSYQAPPRGSVRSDSFAPKTEIRDAVYWEKMRQSNSKEYFSPKNSVLRLKDMDHPDFLKRYNTL